MRDIASDLSFAAANGPLVATTTVTGATIDLLGFDAAVFKWDVGIGGITFDGTNQISLRAQHSNDGTNWDACLPGDMTLAGGVNASLPGAAGQVRLFSTAHAAPSKTVIGYKGGRRYLRPVAFFAGTHATGTPIHQEIVRGAPHIGPTT